MAQIYPFSIAKVMFKKIILRSEDPGRPKFYWCENGTPEEVRSKKKNGMCECGLCRAWCWFYWCENGTPQELRIKKNGMCECGFVVVQSVLFTFFVLGGRATP